MNVLLSCFACNPFGGSEGIYGWYVASALAKSHSCFIITADSEQESIEKARVMGLVPSSMHFRFIAVAQGFHRNRTIARYQLWLRYAHFQRQLFAHARDWHGERGFDIAQHITFSSWRVPSPLWQLDIPFVWGPISGTEEFPRSCLRSLSPSARVFEAVRSTQTWFARRSRSVKHCARNAVAIPAPHGQAVAFLSGLRGNGSGVAIAHNFFFPDDRVGELQMARKEFGVSQQLRAFAAGNLEGRKGVAIALMALARAKERGVRVEYRVTSRGPEYNHLSKLTKRLGLSDQVRLGSSFSRDEYASQLGQYDICLLPTLRDGGGLSIMEAMLAGCVPIVADWCGPSEAVTEECGYKIPVTNPVEMAEQIATVLCYLHTSRSVLELKGKAASSRISTEYGEDQFVRSMNRIYSAALGAR
jgi:glycosyltransferase involved in cell wall biosynthesis